MLTSMYSTVPVPVLANFLWTVAIGIRKFFLTNHNTQSRQYPIRIRNPLAEKKNFDTAMAMVVLYKLYMYTMYSLEQGFFKKRYNCTARHKDPVV